MQQARPDGRHTGGISWRPSDGKASHLNVRSRDEEIVVHLAATRNTLTVTTEAGTVTAPMTTDSNVVIDGPLLEVNTGQSLIGLPVPASADLAPPPAGISPWWPH